MTFTMDRELCVLPSGVNSLCVMDTATRQAYYYTANILVYVGRGRQRRDRDVLLGECMWPGHRALLFNEPAQALTTWAKGVYAGQEFAVNNIVRFYSSESRFAIHDDQVPDSDP